MDLSVIKVCVAVAKGIPLISDQQKPAVVILEVVDGIVDFCGHVTATRRSGVGFYVEVRERGAKARFDAQKPEGKAKGEGSPNQFPASL